MKKAQVQVERIQVVSAITGKHLPDVYGLEIKLSDLTFNSKAKAEKVRRAVEKALSS